MGKFPTSRCLTVRGAALHCRSMTQPPAPPDPVIPNCLQVILQFGAGTRAYTNVLHAQYTLAGPINPGLAQTLFAAFGATWASSGMAAIMHTTSFFGGVKVKDLRAANNPFVESSGSGLVGTGTAGLVSLGTAMVTTERTQFSGRQFRGRVFWGGLDLDALTDQTHHTAAAGAAGVTWLTNIQTAMAAQAMTLAIGQRHLPARSNKHGTATLPERPANVVPVNAILTVSTRLDTQRRRLGRG